MGEIVWRESQSKHIPFVVPDRTSFPYSDVRYLFRFCNCFNPFSLSSYGAPTGIAWQNTNGTFLDSALPNRRLKLTKRRYSIWIRLSLGGSLSLAILSSIESRGVSVSFPSDDNRLDSGGWWPHAFDKDNLARTEIGLKSPTWAGVAGFDATHALWSSRSPGGLRCMAPAGKRYIRLAKYTFLFLY